jgi:hypothetical protein
VPIFALSFSAHPAVLASEDFEAATDPQAAVISATVQTLVRMFVLALKCGAAHVGSHVKGP